MRGIGHDVFKNSVITVLIIEDKFYLTSLLSICVCVSMNIVKWSSQGMLRLTQEAMNELFQPTIVNIVKHIGKRHKHAGQVVSRHLTLRVQIFDSAFYEVKRAKRSLKLDLDFHTKEKCKWRG